MRAGRKIRTRTGFKRDEHELLRSIPRTAIAAMIQELDAIIELQKDPRATNRIKAAGQYVEGADHERR